MLTAACGHHDMETATQEGLSGAGYNGSGSHDSAANEPLHPQVFNSRGLQLVNWF